MYILSKPDARGNHGNPQSYSEGLVFLPDEFLDKYLDCMGFVNITVEGDKVTAIEKNAEAYNSYHAPSGGGNQ